MRLTKRGKRRVLILFVACLGMAMLLVGFVSLRGIYRSRLIEQSRVAGLEAYKKGHYDEALAKLSYALSPSSTDIEMLLAFADSRARVVELNNRHLITAIGYFNAALKVDPNNLNALTNLLQLYRRVGYRTEAADTADRIIAIDPSHLDAWVAKASLAYQRQAFVEVVAIAERMSERFPRDLSWRRLHIKAMQAQKRGEDDVLLLCDQWVQAHPNDGTFPLLKSQVLAEYGRLPEAREQLIAVLEHDVDSPAMLESTIALLEMLEMRVESDQLIAKSKVRFADLPWVFESSIRRHWQASRTKDALAELAAAEAKFGPSQLGFLKWKALLNAAIARPAEASDAILAIRQLAAQREDVEHRAALAWAHAIEARINVASLNWRELTDVYENAISSYSNDPVLLFLLAEHYQRIGEHQLALELLNQAASQDPNWLALHVARADALLSLERPEEAFSVAGAVIKRAPSAGISAYLVLCKAWLALGERGDQIAILDSAVTSQITLVDLVQTLHRRHPDNPQINRILIDSLMRRGQSQESKVVIQQALADPNATAAVLQALAEASVVHQLGLEGALLERARVRSANAADVAINECVLLHRLGRTDDALRILQSAIEAGNGPSLRDLQWLRARLLVESNKPGGESDLLKLVQSETRPLPLLALLDSEIMWTKRQVIRAAIDQLRTMFAGRSPRVQLAHAAFLYRFERNSPAAIAEALEIVNSVLRENSESKHALALMAQLQVSGDNPDSNEALRYLQRAVSLYPDDGSLLSQLVLMLQEHGDYHAVRQLLSHAPQQGRQDRSFYRLQADLLAGQGDYEQALERMRLIPEAQLQEQDSIQLANLEAKTGDIAAAEARLMRLVEAPGASMDAFVAAAQFCAARGLIEEALDLLSRGIPADQPLAQFYRGTLLLQLGDLENAESALNRAAEMNATDIRVWIELTKLHVAKGNLVEARDAALRAIQLDSQSEVAQAMLAMVAVSLGDSDRQHVMNALAKLQNLNPGLERILRLYGALANPTAEDFSAAKQLTHDYPRWSAAWKLAISMHAHAGHTDEAIRLAKQASTWLPADAATHEMGARLLIQAGQIDEALRMARDWRRLTLENSLSADSVIAALLLDLNQPRQALDHMKPHIDRLATRPDAFADQLEIALIAIIESDRYDDARSIIERLVVSEQWRTRLLGVAAKISQPAAERVMQSVGPHCQSAADRIELAAAWIVHGKRFRMSAAFEQAQNLMKSEASDPKLRVDALVLQADIAAALDQWPQAEEMYRTALKLSPQHPAALNNLAYLLIRHGNKCEEAITLASHAASSSDNHPSVLDTLAQALLCVGRHVEAERWAKAALEKQPRDPSLLVTLAAIRHAQGRTRDAGIELERARNAIDAQRYVDAEAKARLEDLQKQLAEQSSSAG